MLREKQLNIVILVAESFFCVALESMPGFGAVPGVLPPGGLLSIFWRVLMSRGSGRFWPALPLVRACQWRRAGGISG